MLSEERYFDASALTIFEILTSPKYAGLSISSLPPFSPSLTEADIRQIRSVVFADDAVLREMKKCGINANWDMVYLQSAFQLAAIVAQLKQTGMVVDPLLTTLQDGWTQEGLQHFGHFVQASGIAYHIDFASFVPAAARCRAKAELFQWVDHQLFQSLSNAVPAFSADRVFWMVGQACFQEWYLGDEYVLNTRQPGKQGFLKDEVPIVQPEDMAHLLQTCRNQGIRIGIGTGRPHIETRVPLENLGLLTYFEDQQITTASDVLDAERQFPTAAPLAKPHPFCYLRSLLGKHDVGMLLNYPLPIAENIGQHVLIVGDSVADCLAAKSLGCRFAAVLTGLEGAAVRDQFEALQADYIFEDVLGLHTLLT